MQSSVPRLLVAFIFFISQSACSSKRFNRSARVAKTSSGVRDLVEIVSFCELTALSRSSSLDADVDEGTQLTSAVGNSRTVSKLEEESTEILSESATLSINLEDR